MENALSLTNLARDNAATNSEFPFVVAEEVIDRFIELSADESVDLIDAMKHFLIDEKGFSDLGSFNLR